MQTNIQSLKPSTPIVQVYLVLANPNSKVSLTFVCMGHSYLVTNAWMYQIDMMGQFVQPQQTGFQQNNFGNPNFQNNMNTGFSQQQNQQPYRGW